MRKFFALFLSFITASLLASGAAFAASEALLSGGEAPSVSGPASASKGMARWQEPTWLKSSPDEFLFRWKYTEGDSLSYRETRKTSTTTEGKEKTGGYTVKVEHLVNWVEGGKARVDVRWKHMGAKGSGADLLDFLEASTETLGSYTISPAGRMTDVVGALSLRSLPSFPAESVQLWQKWSAKMEIAFAPNIPDMVAVGECSYRLAGLADVNGHKWAKVVFSGALMLPQREFAMRKSLGVKRSTEKHKSRGVLIGDVAPGYPAHEAGIRAGDVILSLGAMSVDSWSDLRYAIMLLPSRGVSEAVVSRGKARVRTKVKPRVETSSKLSLKGTVNGLFVFDLTDGVLVRVALVPLNLQAEIDVGGRKFNQTIEVRGVDSTYRSYQGRGSFSGDGGVKTGPLVKAPP